MIDKFHQGLLTLFSFVKELTFYFTHSVDDLEAFSLTLHVLYLHWSRLEFSVTSIVKFDNRLGDFADVLCDLTGPHVRLLLENLSVERNRICWTNGLHSK